MRTPKGYLHIFQGLHAAVKAAHEASPVKNGAHGLEHDVTVATLSAMIAPDMRTSDKAWCASMLHSVDHLCGRYSNEEEKVCIKRAIVEKTYEIAKHLDEEVFSVEEREEIVQAALRHGEMNQDDQSLTQQVLMDADRLASLQVSIFIRASQNRYARPALEFQYLEAINPESTYSNPLTPLDDVRWGIHDYLPQMRIPKAKEMAVRYARRLERILEDIKADHDEMGLTGVVL